MPEPSDTDWAYAAGFVDGEGCIAIVRSFEPRRGRYCYGVNVVVSNNEWSVLDWMHQTWGGWVVAVKESPSRGANARSGWTWRVSTSGAKPFLAGIRSFLKVKVRQCDNAMVMAELLARSRRTLGRAPLPQAWLDEQEQHYWVQRELNHRGTTDFVARPMHSPRQIHRDRLLEDGAFSNSDYRHHSV